MSGGGRRRAGSSWPSFSRFFAPRSPSRDEEEEKPAVSQPPAGGALSSENGPVTINQKTENTPSTEPVKISQSENSRSHSEKSANLSPEEDSKKPDNFSTLPSDAKTVDSDKQPKEGFLQFLGNLFNISAKSPHQPTLKSEHDKTEKDSQNITVLHEEEFKKQSDICSSSLKKPDPTTEEKNLRTSVDLSDAISQDVTQDSEQESNELLKKVEHEPEIPSITHSTYRGPRQILKILKKQTKLETFTSVQRTDETSDSSASTQTGTGSESEASISPDSPIKDNTDVLKDPLPAAVLNNSNYKESTLNKPSSSNETISSSIVESCYSHPLNYVPVYKIDNHTLGSVFFGNDTKDHENSAFQRIVNPKTTLENNFLKNDRASEQRGEHFQPPSILLSDPNVGLTNRESETVKHECEDLPSLSKTAIHDELGLPESKYSVSYHFGSIVHHHAETDTELMDEENASVIHDSQINMQAKENTKEKEISSTKGFLSSANILHAQNEVVGSLLEDTDYSITTKNKSFDSGPSDKVSQGIIIIQNDHPSIKFVNESEKVDGIQNSITPKLKFEVVNRNRISVSSFESENLELAKVLPESSDVNNEKPSPILESEKADFYDSAPTCDFEGGIFRKWEAPVLKNTSPPIEHEQDIIVHSTTLKEINLVLPDLDSEEIYQAEISPSDYKFEEKHLQTASQSEAPVPESDVVEGLLHGHDSKVIGSVIYDENKASLGPHEPRDIDGSEIISDKSGGGLSSSDVLPKSQNDGTLHFLGSDISVAKITTKLKAKSSLEVSSMLRAEEAASFQRHYEKNNLLGDSRPEEANMLNNASKPEDNFEILKVTTELSREDASLIMMMSTNDSLWEFEKANQTAAEMTLCHGHGKDGLKSHMGKGAPNYVTAAVLKNAMEADAQTVACATVSVNSSSQRCSEASAEDTGARRRAHERPLDSNRDLVKIAEKLVDIILDSARQELKSTRIGVNYQDCNAVTLKEEATGVKASEEKEKTLIQLPDSLDVCGVEDVSEDKREEKACVLTTVGESNLLIDTNKMDMSNLLIIKARELVNEVIHGAQQKLIDSHYRKTKSRNHTRSTEKANATKILNNDIVKPHYIAKGFLTSEQPESQSITKLSENKESESLLAKSNVRDSTKGREIVPYQKTLNAGNGFEQSDSVELPKSNVLLSENISHNDFNDKYLLLTCNKEDSEVQKAPCQLESVDNLKTQTEDSGTLVLNFKWPPFMNDEVHTHLPSTSKSSFSDSLVCINEKCLPGHSNKSLPIAMLEMGKVCRKDAEFDIGKIEVVPPILEMGKVCKKSTELNVGKNELMPSVLETGKSYGRCEFNSTKLEGTPDNFKMGKPFKRNTDEMTPVMIELEKVFEKDIEGNVGKTTISTKLKMEKTHGDDIQFNITQAYSTKPTILEIAKMDQNTAEGNIGESKVIPAIFEVEKVYQMDTEENFGKTEMRPIETKESVVQCDNKAESQFEGYELPTLNKDCEGNIGLMTPDFLPDDSKLRTEKNLCMTAVCGKERILDYDIVNEQSHLAFMPQDEQGNSSFTILYEKPLQDEGQYLSVKEEGAHSLVFPEESTNGLPHVLVCERSESRTDLVHHFEKESKSGEMFESDSSEMFLSVEAKRYKVYPLALSPIYEDDSSQEDILSSEVSPGHRGSSAKSRDDASQSSSVLSLLQSVSERLRMNFDDGEKLETEEEVVDEDEEGPQHKEIILKTGKREHVAFQLPDCSPVVYQGEDHEGVRSSKMPLFLSNEPTTSNQQTVLWQDRSLLYHAPGHVLQKSDLSSKLHSSFKSVYNQYLQTSKILSPEKGPKFGGNLQEPISKLSTCSENTIDKQSLKSNPRPGKMVIYDLHGSKYKQEIYSNILDATSWTFPNGAFIRVVRGCWILYEKTHFQGHKCVLEEGEKVLNRDWIYRSKKHQTKNFVIGSIKRVLKDCSVPEIELCPQSDAACCPIYLQRSVANLEELNLPRSMSFAVKAGVWLAFPDVNFKGQVTILEEGHGLFEISASEVKSLHPLQMGGLKVEMPMNLRVIIYDKTHFLGQAKEFNEHVDSVPELFRNKENFFGIASIRVIGGV